jgi:TonB family protein
MKVGAVITSLLLLSVAAITQATQSNPAGEVTPPARVQGNVEVLTDTQGVDFGPYLSQVLGAVRKNWYNFVPAEARAPEMKSGKVAIEFAILREGRVAGMKLVGPSGDIALDRAAWGGIVASIPFAPLPEQFTGPYLSLRFHFYYNPTKMPPNSVQSAPK